MQETKEMQVRSLGWQDPLEEGMATHSSILSWRIQWTEESGNIQFTGSQSRTQLKWLSTHKQEWSIAIYSNVDDLRDYHTKWSKSDREKQIDDTTYVESKKIVQMNLLTKQKETQT